MSNFAASVKNFINEWSLNILILLFGTTTLVQAFIVPTASMETTVMVGDHMFVDKLAYAPAGTLGKLFFPYTEVKRGDVIVFRYPVDIRQNYVKRVIGIPGDRIHITKSVVSVNGKPLTEPYARHVGIPSYPDMADYNDNFPTAPLPVRRFAPPMADSVAMLSRAQDMLTHTMNGDVVVPDGFYFAMGDNRDNSLDSRYWGFVPRENIIGKPVVIFWSYDADTADLVGYNATHFVDLAKNFFSKTRWERTFKLVRGYPIE